MSRLVARLKKTLSARLVISIEEVVMIVLKRRKLLGWALRMQMIGEEDEDDQKADWCNRTDFAPSPLSLPSPNSITVKQSFFIEKAMQLRPSKRKTQHQKCCSFAKPSKHFVESPRRSPDMSRHRRECEKCFQITIFEAKLHMLNDLRKHREHAFHLFLS